MLAVGCLHLCLHQAIRQNEQQCNHTHWGDRNVGGHTTEKSQGVCRHGTADLVRSEGLRQAEDKLVEAYRTYLHRHHLP